jgi:hypothetical protein
MFGCALAVVGPFGPGVVISVMRHTPNNVRRVLVLGGRTNPGQQTGDEHGCRKTLGEHYASPFGKDATAFAEIAVASRHC